MRNSIGLRVLALLLPLSATLGLTGRPAQAQMVDALNRAYKRATEDFKGYGIDDTVRDGNSLPAVRGAWLVKGESKISGPSLQPGVEYAIIAAGNSHIKKLSLKILDSKGKTTVKEGDPVITESSEDNNTPGCTVKLDKAKYGSKPYLVGVRLEIEEMESTDEKNDGWVCYIILQKDGGWEVPLENFEKATAGLQARLDAMVAAHPNGAEISHDSIPLQGVVLKPNASATLWTPYPKENKYRFVATSDGNAESLAIGLGGNLVAATKEELGDDGPKLTYSRNQPLTGSETGKFSVKSLSKEASLVLTIVIRLVEGS